ncbi:thiol-disulfide isomerase/thioredoxin [Nocardiopsis arvandica]|uniref:Thiol-disulfide isomerase/thioredoxin n=2 Tax=Nocardiopsis sinuspersici TaxID=501010 RepID=A0A7Z0BKD7_9ACTN|nr:thiol-disulfide isomerase/thioredoxin [Nocardiopsis sinuspersici]
MDLPGVIALAVTLSLATVAGLVWRRGLGRFRAPRGTRGRVVPAGGRGAVHREESIQGEGDDMAESVGDAAGGALSGEDIGAELGERATLVQFSTAFCQPCRATRRILDEVADMVGGVAHVEVDAESRLDLVRRLDIMRTPTVLVLDASGRVVRRASGQPRKPDVIAAVGAAVS